MRTTQRASSLRRLRPTCKTPQKSTPGNITNRFKGDKKDDQQKAVFSPGRGYAIQTHLIFRFTHLLSDGVLPSRHQHLVGLGGRGGRLALAPYPRPGRHAQDELPRPVHQTVAAGQRGGTKTNKRVQQITQSAPALQSLPFRAKLGFLLLTWSIH